MKSTQGTFRSIWALMAILSIAGIIIFIYFMELVPEREKELRKRGFRILRRIEKNFYQKKNHYHYNIDTIYSRLHSKADSLYNPRLDTLVAEITDLATIPQKEKNSAQIKHNEKPEIPTSYSGNNQTGKPVTTLKLNEKESKWEIRIQGKIYKNEDIRADYKCLEFPESKVTAEYRFGLSRFIEPILNSRKDFFEDYIIFSDSTLVYQTKNLSYGHHLNKDSTFNYGTLLSAKEFETVLVGKKYIVFAYPFNRADGLKLTICGIISHEKYANEKFGVDTYQILITLLALSLLLLSMPLIKIFAIGRLERFDKLEVLKIILSIILISLIVSTFISSRIFSQLTNTWNKQDVKNLNSEIKNKLNKEIKKQISNLIILDSLILNDTDWLKMNISKTFTNIEANKSFLKNYPDSLRKNLLSDNIKNIILTDSIGNVNALWQYSYENIPLFLNLRNRDYVKRVVNNNLRYFSEDFPNHHFHIEPEYSYLKEEYSVFFSKRTNHSTLKSIYNQNHRNTSHVTAIDCKLNSVMNTVLPEEYGFCIIDEKGQVLFHNEDKRNLNENLYEECDYKPLLMAAVSNRSEVSQSISFYGKDFLTYIQPLNNGIPWFIVTFRNLDYERNSNSDILFYSLSTGLLICLILFIICLIHYLNSDHGKLLKYHRWTFKFLNENAFNITSANNLLKILIIYTILFAFCSLLLNKESLTLISTITPLFIPFITGILLYLNHKYFYQKYPEEKPPFSNIFTRKYKNLAIISGLSIITVSGTVSYLIYGNGWKFIFWSLIIIAILLSGVYIRSLNLSEKFNNYHLTSKMYRLYPSVSFLFIINICLIPSCNTIREAATHEYFLNSRRRQLDCFDQLKQRLNNKVYNPDSNTVNNINGIYLPANNCLVYPGKSGIICSPEVSDKKENIIPAFFKTDSMPRSSLYSRIIKLKNTNSPDYENIKELLSDRKINEHNLIWEDSVFSFKSSFSSFSGIDKEFCATSPAGIYKTFPDGSEWINIAVLVFILFLFYFLVYTIITYLYKKIRLLDYVSKDNFQNNSLDSTLAFFFKGNPGNKLLIHAVPGFIAENELIRKVESEISSTSAGFSSEEFCDKHIAVSLIDIEELCKKFNQDKNIKIRIPAFNCIFYKHNTIRLLLILNYNFKEGNISDKEILNFGNLLKSEDISVIYINHQYQLTSLNNFFYNIINNTNTNVESTPDFKNKTDYLQFMIDIFGNYEKVIIPINKNKLYRSDLLRQDLKFCPYIKKVVEKEFLFLNTLSGWENSVYNIITRVKNSCNEVSPSEKTYNNEEKLFRNNPHINEEIIIEIQSFAYNYYLSVWNSLSSPEKLVLYDFSRDRILNYRDIDIIILLKKKGILLYHDYFYIFNKSFRNFILTEVSDEETDVIEKQLKVRYTWKKTKMIIVIFFLTVGLFLFFTRQEVFQKISGFILAIGSVIPILVELFGKNFSNKGNTKQP